LATSPAPSNNDDPFGDEPIAKHPKILPPSHQPTVESSTNSNIINKHPPIPIEANVDEQQQQQENQQQQKAKLPIHQRLTHQQPTEAIVAAAKPRTIPVITRKREFPPPIIHQKSTTRFLKSGRMINLTGLPINAKVPPPPNVPMPIAPMKIPVSLPNLPSTSTAPVPLRSIRLPGKKWMKPGKKWMKK
jgi:hypothetical protein